MSSRRAMPTALLAVFRAMPTPRRDEGEGRPPLRPRRSWSRSAAVVARTLAALLVAAVSLTVAGPAQALDGTHYVSVTGSDSADGTSTDPWQHVDYALSRAEPGDVIVVGPGTYDEDVNATPAGTPTAPIALLGEPGALIQGLVRLTPSYFTWDNVDVTWPVGASSEEHMVRISGGTDWSLTGSELYDARSYAALNITGDPANWVVASNYIHDTWPSNQANQDHLVYFSNGTAGGVIERNVLAHSPNGRAVKIGSAGSAPTNNVTVRYNTMVDNLGPSNVQVSSNSSDNQVYRNIMDGSSAGNVTTFNVVGSGNVASENVGWRSKKVVADNGTTLVDGGGNEHRDPQLDEIYRPQDPVSQDYGAYAP